MYGAEVVEAEAECFQLPAISFCCNDSLCYRHEINGLGHPVRWLTPFTAIALDVMYTLKFMSFNKKPILNRRQAYLLK